MKALFFTLTLLLAMSQLSFSQKLLDRARAEESVQRYMMKKTKNYVPLTFGELFSQYYSEGLQKIAKTKQVIKCSIVHSYTIKHKTITHTYFHLNESYEVVGHNTEEELGRMEAEKLKNNPRFDSMMESIPVSN